MVLSVVLYVVGVLLILTGLVGLLLPGLPGAPLMFAGVFAVAWADGFTRIGWPGLLGVGAIALVISLVDYASSALGAKRYGASLWGVAGAFLGLLAGLPFGLAGLVIGPVLGAVLLEMVKDPDLGRAANVGVGTLIGFVVGTAVKYALAVLLLVVAAFAYSS
jgi:uncharacterized protein YqgC (DUF456 family)